MSRSHRPLDAATSPFARGWYLVSWSVDLEPGKVVPLRYFAEDFVLYRGEDGRPVLLDAHCPHLGAHFGYGGRVDGCDIVCPFHGWRFSPAGQCADIPYATRIPPRARVRSYPVREHSGMIFGYFDGEGIEPDYEVPELVEFGDPAWLPLERAEIEIATEPREVIENVADSAHFGPVHGTEIEEFEVIIDGPRATQRMVAKGQNLEGKTIDVVSVATYYGPAVQFTRLGLALPVVLINAHIPIDEERLLLRFGISLRSGEGAPLPRAIVDAHIAAMRDGYFQDVAIWENKRWRDAPVLVDGDGPIQRIRTWYASFFPNEGGPLVHDHVGQGRAPS